MGSLCPPKKNRTLVNSVWLISLTAMHSKFILLLGLGFGLARSLWANEKKSLELRWENDSFLDPFGEEFTDRHYTQGFFLRYWNGDDSDESGFLWSSQAMRSVWNLGMEVEATRGGIAFGQEIYTPEDIAFGPSFFGVGYSLDAFDVQVDDRPYAGYLFVEPQWERRGTVSFFAVEEVPVRDRFGIALGVVGPASGAEEVQTRWHDLFNGVEPVGWEQQLENEFAFTLHAERTWLLQYRGKQSALAVDLMPTVGFDLGNVSTRLTVGSEVRVGFGDVHAFALPSMGDVVCGNGFYLFASAEGWAVGRNIFLDGNTFRDSHSVDKERWVGEVSFGFGFRTPVLEGQVGWVGRSKEFEIQDESNSYLSLSAKILF